ncbi:MAG: YcgN family cysteine cluster protein [Desulfobacteraceae bacterium]|jgi:uncharacterized protein|nr:YcgN family cysteine cluster protein [Desulfobacteraceae bacterium]MBT4363934.1 YcgN family cysteine cluster protein [Desulfobacteraceae bacterium]
MDKYFWEIKSLHEMTETEWESLCDGCSMCCLEKIEYEDTGEVLYTCVACMHLDITDCSCKEYKNRFISTNCKKITAENILDMKWLPDTCAYKTIAEGRSLEWWHPLISGDKNTIHDAGISISNIAISGKYIHPDDLESYVIQVN